MEASLAVMTWDFHPCCCSNIIKRNKQYITITFLIFNQTIRISKTPVAGWSDGKKNPIKVQTKNKKGKYRLKNTITDKNEITIITMTIIWYWSPQKKLKKKLINNNNNKK